MNLLTKIFQVFSSKAEPSKMRYEADIKFSALIKNIQQDILDANQSLECVGIKYIEQFFEKEPDVNKVAELSHKIDTLEKELVAGDLSSAKKSLVDLKSKAKNLAYNKYSEGDVCHYRPIMTSFDFPILQNGEWRTEVVNMPLFALSPMQIPKINELTLTSKVERVQRSGDDVYVRFLQKEPRSRWRKNKAMADDNVTELKISISPEESSSQLDEVITQYEQVLRSH